MYITDLTSFSIYCYDSLLVKIYAFKFVNYSDNFLTCHKIFIYIFSHKVLFNKTDNNHRVYGGLKLLVVSLKGGARKPFWTSVPMYSTLILPKCSDWSSHLPVISWP